MQLRLAACSIMPPLKRAVTQGGALVDVGQLRGFVPLSKMDPARLPRNAQGAPGNGANGANGANGSNGLTPKDLAHLVGKPIAAKIIQVCPRTTAGSCLLTSAAHISSQAVQRMLNRSLSAAFEAKGSL